MSKEGFTTYEQARKNCRLQQEKCTKADKKYVVFKPSFKTFHICPLKMLHTIPIKYPEMSAFECVSDAYFDDEMGCHTYVDIDITSPRKEITYTLVIDRVTKYLLETFQEHTSAKMDIEGFRCFWCVADDDPNKLSIHGVIQHPCFIWKYGYNKDDVRHSQKHFIQLVNQRIIEKQDTILLGTTTRNGIPIVESYVDEAPYNTKGNASIRLCGSSKNGKRRLIPIDTTKHNKIELSAEVLENFIISSNRSSVHWNRPNIGSVLLVFKHHWVPSIFEIIL